MRKLDRAFVGRDESCLREHIDDPVDGVNVGVEANEVRVRGTRRRVSSAASPTAVEAKAKASGNLLLAAVELFKHHGRRFGQWRP